MNSSETILSALERAGNSLSADARAAVCNFISSNLHSNGGFCDRAGKQDPYYCVFGYSLVLALNIPVNLEEQYTYLENYRQSSQPDFIHAISLIRCHMLLAAIKEKQRLGRAADFLKKSGLLKQLWQKQLAKKLQSKLSDCFEIIENYRAADGGYNHEETGAAVTTTYAAFIAWSLFDDLACKPEVNAHLATLIQQLKCSDGSYANQPGATTGPVTSTAAAIITMAENNQPVAEDTLNWLAVRQTSHGGFTANSAVPLPDLLSTATALLAMNLNTDEHGRTQTNTGDIIKNSTLSIQHFVDLHWDESGGFFGSAVDQTADIEYTYYALLTLGLAA